MTYKKQEEATKYLGLWINLDLDTDKGMKTLKEKMQLRLNKIKGIRTSAVGKARLIRGKLISTWNYTTTLEELNIEEAEIWDKKIYEEITKGDFNSNIRKEIIYEDLSKLGLGMIPLKEETSIQKMRALTQIMQSGERIRGREQIPWAQQMLIEEMKEEQPLIAVKEMMEILKNTDLEIKRNSETYKPWTIQNSKEEIKEKIEKMDLPIYQGQMELEGIKVPTHVVEYFQRREETEERIEPVTKAIMLMKRRRDAIEEIEKETGKKLEESEGIRLKRSTIKKLEDITKSKLIELRTTVTNRSTELIVSQKEITDRGALTKEVKLLLINNTVPIKIEEAEIGEKTTKQKETIKRAIKEGVTIIILGERETEKEKITTMIKMNQIKNFESPFGHKRQAQSMEGQNQVRITIIPPPTIEATNQAIRLAEIFEIVKKEQINNMYKKQEEEEEISQWKCPLCKAKGERINDYGICRNIDCMGIRTERTTRIRSERLKRCAETYLLNKEGTKKVGTRTRMFWTDGSGKGTHKIKQTAWATVEVEQKLEKEGNISIRKKKTWAGRSKDLESVPRCEARAILKAIQVLETGEAAHIHTDSKVTIQNIRAMTGKTYREKRRMENKDIIQEIIEIAEVKQAPIMIEWVKGHETMLEESHNWISKMKEQGNEWADEEAKKAVEREMEEEKQKTTEARVLLCFDLYSLVWITSGLRVSWNKATKILKEDFKEKRREEARKPKDLWNKYGQGRRLEKSREDRSILIKEIVRATPDIHTMAINFTTNRIFTREFDARMKAQKAKYHKKEIPETITEENKICPLCKLKYGTKKSQTKEHIWSGECCLTEGNVRKMFNTMQETLKKWRVKEKSEREILKKIEEEWQRYKKAPKEEDLEIHKEAGSLIGLWRNRTIQIIIKILTEEEIWEEEIAMERVQELAKINMKSAVDISKSLAWNRNIMKTDIQKIEQPMSQEEIEKEIRVKKYTETMIKIITNRCISIGLFLPLLLVLYTCCLSVLFSLFQISLPILLLGLLLLLLVVVLLLFLLGFVLPYFVLVSCVRMGFQSFLFGSFLSLSPFVISSYIFLSQISASSMFSSSSVVV